MGEYTPPPIDVIWERIHAAQRARERKAAEPPTPVKRRPLKARPRRARHGTPHNDGTKARLRETSRRVRARKALNDPATSALRRARIERRLTLKEAAAETGLHFNTIWAAETGRYVSDETWDVLAGTFGAEVRP